jgi:hypothetical protein
MDQIAARVLGLHTPLPSLEIGIEGADTIAAVGTCDPGFPCAYEHTISWSSPTTPMPMEANPRVVFERLFGDIGSTDANTLRARTRRQTSILDSVFDKVGRLKRQIGPGDRVRLEQYLDSVREVERRVQNAAEQGTRDWPSFEAPAGIPSSYDAHVRLMFDLQALAYQSDMTHVISFQVGREHSGMTYPQIGVSDAHHPISHHGGDKSKMAKVAKINAYHVSLFAYYLDTLRSIPDGDGTLLDNVLLLYGSALSDGNKHDYRDVPVLIAGGAGGQAKGGRYIKYPRGSKLSDLQLTILNAIGAHSDSFGDSSGDLPGLLS